MNIIIKTRNSINTTSKLCAISTTVPHIHSVADYFFDKFYFPLVTQKDFNDSQKADLFFSFLSTNPLLWPWRLRLWVTFLVVFVMYIFLFAWGTNVCLTAGDKLWLLQMFSKVSQTHRDLMSPSQLLTWSNKLRCQALCYSKNRVDYLQIAGIPSNIICNAPQRE